MLDRVAFGLLSDAQLAPQLGTTATVPRKRRLLLLGEPAVVSAVLLLGVDGLGVQLLRLLRMLLALLLLLRVLGVLLLHVHQMLPGERRLPRDLVAHLRFPGLPLHPFCGL